MKKVFSCVMFLCIALCLVGCLDITEYVNADNDNIKINVNITVSKAMIELINSTDENQIDYKDILDENTLKKDLPKGFKMEKIDNITDFGFSMKGFISKQELSKMKNGIFLVPMKYRSGYIMPLYSDNSDMNEIDDSTFALMSSYKFKLFISKDYIPYIKRAFVETGKDKYNISFYDFDDMYLLDMPLFVMFTDKPTLKIE